MLSCSMLHPVDVTCILPTARRKRKSENQGRLTKARLIISQDVSIWQGSNMTEFCRTSRCSTCLGRTGRWCNSWSTDNVNLLTPHTIICFVCEESITFDSIGGLPDFKRHLQRHKISSNEIFKEKSVNLLTRWTEIDCSVAAEQMTFMPSGLKILTYRESMLCLKTLGRILADRSYNVLLVHN